MAGRVVLITGGSRGIGAAAARRFAAGGDTVVVNYCRSREKAEALAAEIGGWAVQADVSDSLQVGKMVDNVLDKFCQLDILVCNAGIAQQKLFGDLTDEDWRRMFAVNVDGMFYAIRAALPHFIHRKAGRILTLSSMWGQVGGSCEVAYSAAKAAVIGLTKALAKELGPSGITVNCVSPGVIDTEMNGNLTPEAAINHPNSNVITRYISVVSDEENRSRATVVCTKDLQAGDYLFLCSDGVLACVPDEILLDTLSNPSLSDEQKIARLANLSRNSHDNNTAILIPVASVETDDGETDYDDSEDFSGGNTISLPRFTDEVKELSAITTPTFGKRLGTWWKKLFRG